MKAPVIKSEKDVKKQVRTLLVKHGWWPWMPPANGFGKTGISDFHALHEGGTFLAVETKFNGNKPTVNQRAFLETISAHNSFAFVVDEKTIDAFGLWLGLFDKSVKAVQRKEKVPDEDGAAMLDAMKVLTEGIVGGKNNV
jgi:hypothetical protein